MTIKHDRRSLLAGAIGAISVAAIPASALTPRKAFFDPIKRQIGLQLYSLGEAPSKDLEGTLRQVAAIGYRDIELPGLLGHQAADIRRAADAAGVVISSIHIAIAGELSIRSDPQQLVDILGALGTNQLVVPMFAIPPGFKMQPGEQFGTAIARTIATIGEDGWKRLAELLNARAAALKPHGIAVGYHNHNVEFALAGARTGWDILVAETDPALIHFEVDIGWVVSAGQDPLAFLRRQAGRVRQVHIKDVKAGFAPNTALSTAPTEVGSGVIDWAHVLPVAYAAGARHFYVEQEPPFTVPRIEAAAKSYGYLAQLRTVDIAGEQMRRIR